jgi:hypothetical protein
MPFAATTRAGSAGELCGSQLSGSVTLHSGTKSILIATICQSQ